MKFVPHLLRRSVRPASRRQGIEALESRLLLSVTLSQPLPNATFPQGSSPQSIDMSQFFFDSTTFRSDLTFTAKSDNTALITPTVTNSELTLGVSSNGSGYAHVRITATAPDGGQAFDVIRLKVTASADRSLDVPIGPGHRSFHFAQANHASATITLSGPGSGTIHMGGDGLQLRGDHTVGGFQELESINLTGTTAATTLTIRGRTPKRQDAGIGDITTDGALKSILIKKAQLVGDINAAGAVPVIDMDFATNGSINLGPSTRPMSLKIGTFADENFSSASPIGKINALQWLNSDSVSEAFSANYVKKLVARGNFLPGLQLTGTGGPNLTLGHNKVGGSVGGTWNISGASSPLIIGGANPDWNATFTSLSSIKDLGNFSGSLTLPTLNLLQVKGTMGQASLNLTAPNTTDLGRLVVRGTIVVSRINAAGELGSISAEALQLSNVFAGVGTLAQGQALPASTTDFANSATIESIALHPRRKVVGFAGSNIAATNIGDLSLGTIRTDNAGTQFGVAAVLIGHISGTDTSHHRSFSFANVNDAAGLAADMAAHKLNLGDMVIQII